MTYLTKHFSIEEMTITNVKTASNKPLPSIISNLYRTTLEMEKIRTILEDHPIIVTSGYRSAEVNTAVGGSPTSDHMKGLACDFICPHFGTPADIVEAIKLSDLKYDQLIHEITWVHIGFGPKMRQEFLDKSKKEWAVS